VIDWANLAANALWIMGCAIALATLSYTRWEAWIQQDKFSRQLQKKSPQFFLNLAGLLFSLGLAGTAEKTYEVILWLVMAGLFLVQIVFGFALKQKNDPRQRS